MQSSQLNQALRLVRRTGDKMVVFDQESDSGYAIMNLDQYEDLLNDADWMPPTNGDDDDDEFDPREFVNNLDLSNTEWPATAPWEDDDLADLTPETTPDNLTTEPEWGSEVTRGTRDEGQGDDEIKLSDNFVPEFSEPELALPTKGPLPVPKNFSSRSGFEHIGSIASRKIATENILPEPTVEKIAPGILEEVSLSDVPHSDGEETFLLEPVE